MEFKKTLIQKNTGAIDSEIHQLQTQKNYFQNYVNQLASIGIAFDTNDLVLLFDAPKEFVTDKLTNSEQPTVGGLKLSKDKLFDLLEKPKGTEEIIASIEKDLQTQNIREFNIWKVNSFEVSKNCVEIKKAVLESIETKHSIFINNINQQKVFDNLNKVATLINEINRLDSMKIDLDIDLSDLFKIVDKSFKIDANILKRFE